MQRPGHSPNKQRTKLWQHRQKMEISKKKYIINLSERLDACPFVRSGGVDRSAMRRFASLTYFREVLLCPHKHIVTMTKVYIAPNNTIP